MLALLTAIAASLKDSLTVGWAKHVRAISSALPPYSMCAQAAAINEQKVSPNIKNVVVLDEFGDLGDGNVGEYLKYTAGISIVAGPQTAATLSIRGMPAGGVVFIMTSTSPAIRLTVAGAMPLNGMCTMSVAVAALNNSMPKCEVVPLPPVE